MRHSNRILRYFKPYWFYVVASVMSMALVGLLDAFRLLLIGPIFDRVLNPASQTQTCRCSRCRSPHPAAT